MEAMLDSQNNEKYSNKYKNYFLEENRFAVL